MPPRIVQWLSVETFDEVVLIARSGHDDTFARTATASGIPVDWIQGRVPVGRVHVDVGQARAIARLRDPSIEEAARAIAMLVEVSEPTRVLFRDLDGTRAIHTGAEGEIVVLDVEDWQRHLVAQQHKLLADAAVLELIDHRGRVAREPDEIEQGMAYLALGRLDDAWNSLVPREQALQLFLTARELAANGFLDDSRALLRAALESVRSLALAKNHPDARVQHLGWTENHPALAALVAEIKAKRGV